MCHVKNIRKCLSTYTEKQTVELRTLCQQWRSIRKARRGGQERPKEKGSYRGVKANAWGTRVSRKQIIWRDNRCKHSSGCLKKTVKS